MLVFFRSCGLTAFRQAASIFPAYCSKVPGHEPDALRQRRNAQEAARNSALWGLAMCPMSTLPRKRDAPLKNETVESESPRRNVFGGVNYSADEGGRKAAR